MIVYRTNPTLAHNYIQYLFVVVNCEAIALKGDERAIYWESRYTTEKLDWKKQESGNREMYSHILKQEIKLEL